MVTGKIPHDYRDGRIALDGRGTAGSAERTVDGRGTAEGRQRDGRIIFCRPSKNGLPMRFFGTQGRQDGRNAW